MYEEYITFAVKAKAHMQLVQDALFSIESSLEKIAANDNKCVNIFRAELIRRALIHDHDKCEEVVIIDGQQVPFQFAEYTVGSDYFIAKRGADAEYDSEEYRKIKSAAYAGLNAFDNHKKKIKDHHPEYHEDCKKDMKLLPLIEMVCDWWGSTAYSNEDPKSKFRADSAKNICHYSFDGYQKFVVERTRDFIDTRAEDLIEIIYKGCTNYPKDSIPPCTSDAESQFYRELNDFLKERINSLAQAKARRSKAWKTL